MLIDECCRGTMCHSPPSFVSECTQVYHCNICKPTFHENVLTNQLSIAGKISQTEFGYVSSNNC